MGSPRFWPHRGARASSRSRSRRPSASRPRKWLPSRGRVVPSSGRSPGAWPGRGAASGEASRGGGGRAGQTGLWRSQGALSPTPTGGGGGGLEAPRVDSLPEFATGSRGGGGVGWRCKVARRGNTPPTPRTSFAQARRGGSRHGDGECRRSKGMAYTLSSANVWTAGNGDPRKSSARPWGKISRTVLEPSPWAGAGQPGNNGGHLNPDLQGRFHSF